VCYNSLDFEYTSSYILSAINSLVPLPKMSYKVTSLYGSIGEAEGLSEGRLERSDSSMPPPL